MVSFLGLQVQLLYSYQFKRTAVTRKVQYIQTKCKSNLTNKIDE